MRKLLAMAGTGFLLLIALQIPVYAVGLDEITGNMVLETSAQADLYEEASDEAKVVTSLEAGTVVFTLDHAEHNWCRISAGEYTGYIKVEYLKTIGDQDLINQEFEQNRNYNHMLYDEIEQREEQENRTKMRGGIVLGLIMITIVAGCIFVKMRIKK
ncbi:MAG: SH3 domain-containing protein [Lachnospiraceae bacterium]|nr:SH3 domain-containing protein [Lachnospiraceae bacterium]